MVPQPTQQSTARNTGYQFNKYLSFNLSIYETHLSHRGIPSPEYDKVNSQVNQILQQLDPIDKGDKSIKNMIALEPLTVSKTIP